ncbi:MAG: hypothetical protein ACP5XB_16875 [Isosphaeraceae bacterium]
MPLVESIDPTLVPELFWRVVADPPVANDPREEYGRDDVLRQALLLARYDRAVASALYEPVRGGLVRPGANGGEMRPVELWLLGALDPRQAVAVVESMPDPNNLETGGVNWLRMILADQLGRGGDMMWTRVWGTVSGLGGVLDRRDVL